MDSAALYIALACAWAAGIVVALAIVGANRRGEK